MRAVPAQPDWMPPTLQKLAPYYVLVLAVCATYSNNLSNAFLCDDYALIGHNAFIADWHDLPRLFWTSTTAGANQASALYRPLQLLAYMIAYHIAGLSEVAFHLLNIALHATNACLVYALARRSNFNSTAALVASIVWALHPIQVEAVTYMSGTPDLLVAFFCLLALVQIAPDFALRKIWIAAPLFALALLSKETAIMFPALVMLSVYVLNRSVHRTLTSPLVLALWAIAGGYLALRLMVFDFNGLSLQLGANPYRENILCRIATFFSTIPFYAHLLLWPSLLHFDRDFPLCPRLLDPLMLLGCAVILASLAYGTARPNRIGWGLLWFFIAYFPCSGILKPLDGVVFEHWMYMPSIGLFLATTEAISETVRKRFPRLKTISVLCAVAIILVLQQAAYAQNTVWRDAMSLARQDIKSGDKTARGYTMMGFGYVDRGEYQEALEEFRQAIALSEDHDAGLYNDYASVLYKLPDARLQSDDVIAHLKRAIEIDPDYYPAINNLTKVYRDLGDTEESGVYAGLAQRTRDKIATGQNTSPPVFGAQQ